MCDRPADRIRRGLLALALVLAACAGEQAPPLDPEIDAGREVYGDVCSTCHGPNGEGGVGPSLSQLTITFPDCEDQIQWITLGTERWTAEIGPNYGATDKPVTGVMPSFAESLTEEQIRQVAAFERFRYAAVGADQAKAECGL